MQALDAARQLRQRRQRQRHSPLRRDAEANFKELPSSACIELCSRTRCAQEAPGKSPAEAGTFLRGSSGRLERIAKGRVMAGIRCSRNWSCIRRERKVRTVKAQGAPCGNEAVALQESGSEYTNL